MKSLVPPPQHLNNERSFITIYESYHDKNNKMSLSSTDQTMRNWLVDPIFHWAHMRRFFMSRLKNGLLCYYYTHAVSFIYLP